MEKIILNEIKQRMNLKEKILMQIWRNIFIKVYKKGIEKGVNSIL